MSKTPEKMAEEYVGGRQVKTPKQLAFDYCDKAPINIFDRLFVSLEEIRVAAFINGYKAGYTAGFDGCLKIQEATTEHLEKQMVEEMYVRMEPLLKEDK